MMLIKSIVFIFVLQPNVGGEGRETRRGARVPLHHIVYAQHADELAGFKSPFRRIRIKNE